jgi:hypothetical protein
MATITPTATQIAGGYMVCWANVAAGDTITPYPVSGSSNMNLDPPDFSVMTDRCAQVVGGTPGTVHVTGSNRMDSTASAFATLHQVDGTTAVSLTSTTAIQQVLEATYYVALAPTGGAAGTNVYLKATAGVNRF